ncbi:SOS response-associated peptidase [Lewinella sp. LCG006]|uniref:SOS response-associated peptidase n=1 Tax=Lewinella sp. LCG006 TaxID=3231911 RepID=UPI00345F9991
MCGRYSQVFTLAQVEQQLEMPLDGSSEVVPNYNVAPTQEAVVILNEAPHLLQPLRWGLVPYWSKDIQQGARLINARSESIVTKPSFRIPIRQRRCLVIADSFYEWRRSGSQKYPYRIIRSNDDLLVMAGIWDIARVDGQQYRTFSIITTAPNQEMEDIHNRMPVLLINKEEQQSWLQDRDVEETLALLKTPDDDVLRYYRVSQQVNNVRSNGPALHQLVNDDPLTLF